MARTHQYTYWQVGKEGYFFTIGDHLLPESMRDEALQALKSVGFSISMVETYKEEDWMEAGGGE